MAKGQIKQKQALINQKQFENACFIQCTESEICSLFGVSKDTLIRWCKRTYKDNFENTYKRFSEGGKASLRRIQWKHAEKNASMAIFLGKQMLGQKDVQETKLTELEKVDELLNKITEQAQ